MLSEVSYGPHHHFRGLSSALRALLSLIVLKDNVFHLCWADDAVVLCLDVSLVPGS